MLRKIDCVMNRVDDVPAAAAYYIRVLGLVELWRGTQEDAGAGAVRTSIGLGLPETDAEIVLHDDPGVPGPLNVHYLVDDTVTACAQLVEQGCTLRVAPLEIAIGWCAVLEDPFGAPLCILDMSKGPRPGTVQ